MLYTYLVLSLHTKFGVCTLKNTKCKLEYDMHKLGKTIKLEKDAIIVHVNIDLNKVNI